MPRVVGTVLVALALLLLGFQIPLTAQARDALQSYKAGKYDEAVSITQKELKQNPSNMDSFVVWCWSLQKLEKHQDAVNVALQAQKVNAFDFRIIEVLGESLFYLGKSLEALKHFEQYAVLAPTGDRIEKVYNLMGEIYLQLGQYNRADIALTTAVYHNPQIPAWWSRLGYARMLAKDYPSAIKAFVEALRQNPNLTEAARGKQQVEALMAKPAAQ
jgi:tetratricopeptide (TPR) repeat protein